MRYRSGNYKLLQNGPKLADRRQNLPKSIERVVACSVEVAYFENCTCATEQSSGAAWEQSSGAAWAIVMQSSYAVAQTE